MSDKTEHRKPTNAKKKKLVCTTTKKHETRIERLNLMREHPLQMDPMTEFMYPKNNKKILCNNSIEMK